MQRQPRMTGQPDLENAALIDHNVIDFTRRCMNNGICIDREHFYSLSEFLQLEIDHLAEQITSYIPKEAMDSFTEESTRDAIDPESFNPDSPEQVAGLLFKHLRVGEGMELTMTPAGDRISTGKKQLQRLKNEHPVIPLILQRREYFKLQHTYCAKLPSLALYDKAWDKYRIFYQIGLTFASTGRMTCSRMHQIPFRTDIGKMIRQGFLAYPGRTLISIDFSQIELRALAHNAKERVMMDIFWNNGDIHAVTQAGLPLPEDYNKGLKRVIAKSVNFGTVFGITDLGLWLGLVGQGVDTTKEECGEFIQSFYKTYPGVLPYNQSQQYRARRYGFVWAMMGHISLVPEARSCNRKVVSEGMRRCANFPQQCGAAEIFKIAAAQVNEFCTEVRNGLFGKPYYLEPLLPIHDQILLEADADIAEEAAQCIAYIMENVVQLRVPIKVDYGISERWEK